MAQAAFIISISSDIGTALAERLLAQGWTVFGTFRTVSSATKRLKKLGARLVECNFADTNSVDASCFWLKNQCVCWDLLVLCPGTTEPIGTFAQIDPDTWAGSIAINFTNQMRAVQRLLPTRRKAGGLGACVLFVAGGGVNNATINYSAYTISKIALIKMCELLDSEIPDTRFAIVGPGWVRTKIHTETLRAGELAGETLSRTREKFEQNDFTHMDDVLDCFEWVASMPRSVIGGRNISVVHDAWRSNALKEALINNPDLYKLRRSGNDSLPCKN